MGLLQQLTAKQAYAKRWRQTPAGKASKAKYRADRKASRQFSHKLKKAERAKHRFVGCDGEGVGRGLDHRYTLFRMGTRELYRDGARLTTPELLDFIVEHPSKTDILVGFAFEYDVTSILVDCSPEIRAKLIAAYEQPNKKAESNFDFKKRPFWTWLDFPGWPRFGVNWLARNHLMVCRANPDPRITQASDRSTIRVIYDTFGFFQSSFVKALKAWEVGAAELATIEAMKAKRSEFETADAKQIRRYNAIECDLLAETMTKFRETCQHCGLEPKTWNGAGKIASFLHRSHDTVRARDLSSLIKPGLNKFAHAAYYGGRFEITRAGQLPAVWEHDINSAYPAAMLKLPCLRHGTWTHEAGETLAALPDKALFVCPVRFAHPREQFLCGLPFRAAKDGKLSWPRNGNGVYWSVEIRSAQRLGATIAFRAGWLYHANCKCKPFDWVERLYLERKALGDLKGKPIKLGLNSLYGKLAQRIGEPPFANPVWAGLITATTRAALNDAIGKTNPKNVVMIATDGIYTVKRPIRLKVGDGLGQWTVNPYPSMFVVQPGLYWMDAKLRSRGVSASVIARYRADFENAWRDYAARKPLDVQTIFDRLDALEHEPDRERSAALGAFAFREAYPLVQVEFDAFIGLRIAAHWGKPELAGTWQRQQRKLSFDWTGKRTPPASWARDRSHVVLAPLWGDPNAYSTHYEEGGTLATSEGWEVERMLFEAMPDAQPEPDADDFDDDVISA
jgi:DNA polymerase type B, organellar and viral